MLLMRIWTDSSVFLAQTLAIAASLLALLALIGNMLHVQTLSGMAHYIPMAANTAFAFLLISTSVLLGYSHQGFMRVFADKDSPGSITISAILLPTSIIIPLVFGWLSHASEDMGYYDMEFALALAVILNIVALLAISYIAARKILLLSFARRQVGTMQIEADRLQAISRQLEVEIVKRKETESRLRDLTKHLLSVREEEKARIAREIHDDLGNTLTTLKLEAYWLKSKLSERTDTLPLLNHIEDMSQLIDNATSVMRSIVTDLRPTILDDLGLQAALKWQAGQFHQRTGIECRLNCVCANSDDCTKPEDCTRIPDKSRAITLFRIAQEALHNVARHSGATMAEIELLNNDEEIVMSVIDNGKGMPKDMAVPSTSYGLRGMRERVAQLGGAINFDTPPSGRFDVTIILPLSAHEEKTA